MKDDQHEFLALVGQPPARLAVEQAPCREKASSPARHGKIPGSVKIEAAITPGGGCSNGRVNELTENASGERAFMDEKQLLTKLPISRRTLGNWKATGILPYIKIGRRCLYDWASVQGALLRRQKGGSSTA
ncbi:MAG TPA: hypothetical protein VH595_00940 [Verrucomicrobiae bacterium]|jgi:hypothetical protein|nr:hypothetical protein [Verrucomicrobiae bacterium]